MCARLIGSELDSRPEDRRAAPVPGRRYRAAGADRERALALRGGAGAARHPRRHPGRQGPLPAPGDPGPHCRDPRARRPARQARPRRAAARAAGRADRGGAARHRLGLAARLTTSAGRGCPGSTWAWRRRQSRTTHARDIVEKLQALRRRVNATTPHALLSQAIDVLRVRPILLRRHRGQAERALANVDLYLGFSRAYAVRGLRAFAEAMTAAWSDEARAVEGRPDAQEDAVALYTMHAAKGLEWPIVVPINTMTGVRAAESAVTDRASGRFYCPVFGWSRPATRRPATTREAELDRERVRLWYVATTRARELLVLPRLDVDAPRDSPGYRSSIWRWPRCPPSTSTITRPRWARATLRRRTSRRARPSPPRRPRSRSASTASSGGRPAGTRTPPSRCCGRKRRTILATDGDGAPADGCRRSQDPGRARARHHPAQADRGGSHRRDGGNTAGPRGPRRRP